MRKEITIKDSFINIKLFLTEAEEVLLVEKLKSSGFIKTEGFWYKEIEFSSSAAPRIEELENQVEELKQELSAHKGYLEVLEEILKLKQELELLKGRLSKLEIGTKNLVNFLKEKKIIDKKSDLNNYLFSVPVHLLIWEGLKKLWVWLQKRIKVWVAVLLVVLSVLFTYLILDYSFSNRLEKVKKSYEEQIAILAKKEEYLLLKIDSLTKMINTYAESTSKLVDKYRGKQLTFKFDSITYFVKIEDWEKSKEEDIAKVRSIYEAEVRKNQELVNIVKDSLAMVKRERERLEKEKKLLEKRKWLGIFGAFEVSKSIIGNNKWKKQIKVGAELFRKIDIFVGTENFKDLKFGTLFKIKLQ